MLSKSFYPNIVYHPSLQEVLINQFVPLLQEYFYDDWHRIQLVLGDVGPGNTKIEPQIVRHTMLRSSSVLGFDHDDFDEKFEYSICEQADITPESIRKIYESSS